MDPNDKLDQWLDQALAQYTNVEPRTGLQRRVIATLHKADDRLHTLRRWWLSTAAVLATVAIIIVAWLGYKLPVKDEAQTSSVTTVTNTIAETKAPNNPYATTASQMHPTRPLTIIAAKARPPHGAGTVATDSRRLQSFPAPRPLSAQEKLLVRYISEDPKHAVLVAREQTAIEQQEDGAREERLTGISTPETERRDR